jgi:hypothetical protein
VLAPPPVHCSRRASSPHLVPRSQPQERERARPLEFVARAAGENGSSSPYSPKCVEEEFSEVHGYKLLCGSASKVAARYAH